MTVRENLKLGCSLRRDAGEVEKHYERGAENLMADPRMQEAYLGEL